MGNVHKANKKGTGSTFMKYQSVAVLFERQIAFSTITTQRVSEETSEFRIWIKVTLKQHLRKLCNGKFTALNLSPSAQDKIKS
jgi:hypothetical protein